MKVFGTSIRGPLHIRKKLQNQDSFLCYKAKSFAVAVISDGLGSKIYADAGSKAVCKSVKNLANQFFCKKTDASVKEVLGCLVSEWQKLIAPQKPKDCSATCLFAIATAKKIFTARLGDGMICLLEHSESGITAEDVLLNDKKDGAFSNETCCISDSNAIMEFDVQVFDRNRYSTIVLATDGISSDLRPGTECAFARDLATDIRQKPFAFLKRNMLSKMLRQWPVGNHSDDKTIVLMEL